MVLISLLILFINIPCWCIPRIYIWYFHSWFYLSKSNNADLKYHESTSIELTNAKFKKCLLKTKEHNLVVGCEIRSPSTGNILRAWYILTDSVRHAPVISTFEKAKLIPAIRLFIPKPKHLVRRSWPLLIVDTNITSKGCDTDIWGIHRLQRGPTN